MVDPAVLQALVGRVAACGIDDEQVGDEVLGAVGDLVPVGRVELVRRRADLDGAFKTSGPRGRLRAASGGRDLANQHRVRVAEEGREPAEHRVQNHPDRPQVHLRAVPIRLVQVRRHHLGRHVPARKAGSRVETAPQEGMAEGRAAERGV